MHWKWGAEGKLRLGVAMKTEGREKKLEDYTAEELELALKDASRDMNAASSGWGGIPTWFHILVAACAERLPGLEASKILERQEL